MEIHLELEKVKPADLALIREIAIETFRDTYGAYNTPENMRDYLHNHFREEIMLAELENPESMYWFAKMSDQIVGYLKLNIGKSQTETHLPHGLEIERIYVLPDYKGKGIGRKMVEKSIEVAKSLEILEVWLGVWEKNPKAIAFYHKMGFQEFDKHVFVLGDEEQIDWMMKMSLSLEPL